VTQHWPIFLNIFGGSVGDECSCLTNSLVVEFWLHHFAPPSTSLTEGKVTDWLQTRSTYVFKCVHGSALPYLADEISRPVDSQARCRLRSASSSVLVVCRTRLTTVGDRSFLVAASLVWNNLHSTSLRHLPFESLKIFGRLIYFLFLFLNLYILFCKVPAMWLLSFWTL